MKSLVRRISFFLLLTTLMGGVVHAEQKNSEEAEVCGHGADLHIYELVNKPTSAIELLRNAKFAIDKRLLLKPDLYSKNNLNKFFAAIEIDQGEKKSNGESRYWGATTHFENLFPHSMTTPGEIGYPAPNVAFDAYRDHVGMKKKAALV